ncbi:hypothetical protein AB0D62_28450 [Streptomyces massasporeus]|uniref:hypothetical protein n=1 Tax=Streptomyces massasporeus TaxID=67324 RepID=UPI00340BD9D4
MERYRPTKTKDSSKEGHTMGTPTKTEKRHRSKLSTTQDMEREPQTGFPGEPLFMGAFPMTEEYFERRVKEAEDKKKSERPQDPGKS